MTTFLQAPGDHGLPHSHLQVFLLAARSTLCIFWEWCGLWQILSIRVPFPFPGREAGGKKLMEAA